VSDVAFARYWFTNAHHIRVTKGTRKVTSADQSPRTAKLGYRADFPGGRRQHVRSRRAQALGACSVFGSFFELRMCLVNHNAQRALAARERGVSFAAARCPASCCDKRSESLAEH
jgi:hypothetical protein